MSTLPNPDEAFINKLENIIFKFLWSNKPDQIKRSIVTKDYYEGGLKMPNIKHLMHSTKIVWVRKLLTQSKIPWVNLFTSTNCTTEKITKF